MKILVTGFMPFGGETVNPAYEAVRRLPAQIAGADIATVEIPVVYRKGPAAVEAAIDAERPDMVLCVGQAGGQGRGTVLGDTGQASMEQRVTYSGPSESGEEETSGASSRRASRSGADSGGNRAERRRSRKKRRH